MKITIIGAGSMGGTAARSFSTSSLFTADDITVTARHQETLDSFQNTGIHTSLSNIDAIKGADIIIIAVRPAVAESVVREIAPEVDFANQIVISFVAGVPSCRYFEWFSGVAGNQEMPSFFLAMPNTAMELNEGLTFISPINAKPIQVSLVKAIFDSVGKSVIIEEELMNAGMALASCGLAYAMKYILSSVQGGIKLGFERDAAIKVVLQTVKGAAMLVSAHNADPEEEINKIATPGGYTIKGLREMENSDFSEVVLRALDASSK